MPSSSKKEAPTAGACSFIVVYSSSRRSLTPYATFDEVYGAFKASARISTAPWSLTLYPAALPSLLREKRLALTIGVHTGIVEVGVERRRRVNERSPEGREST
jgi:hypothetical protein